MSNAGQKTLEFQCPKCARRLKATAQAAGKRLKCPGCGQPVKVPGAQAQTSSDDEWLQLDTPAPAVEPSVTGSKLSSITSIPGAPRTASRPATPPSLSATQPTSASAATPSSASHPGGNESSVPRSGSTASEPPAATNGSVKSSIFDDDLPELAELEPPRPRSDMASILGIEGLDELVPPRPAASNAPTPPPAPPKEPSKKAAALDPANQQYRVPCPSCGTPQYVTLAKKGKLVRCPDCFLEFKIPPPPPDWKPTGKPAHTNWGTGLAEQSVAETEKDAARSRAQADEYLRDAQQELDDNDIDSMYQGDFDTQSFMRRTFGFCYDGTALLQVLAYSLVFAIMFSIVQWCADKIAEGDKGYALISGLGVPVLFILAAFPLFAGAMTMLESVANGQSRVREWPGFSFFDHVGELLLFATAVAAAALPGFLIGGLIVRSGGMVLMVVFGTMFSTFLAFPVILLSMLDNESLFKPFSADVFKSLSSGFEAWGVYYLKTFVAYFVVFIAWCVLLGGSPMLAGLAGAMLPWLIFFTTQQLGVLAFDISEHLSLNLPDEPEEEVTQI